jgi:hypothetical protein
LCWANECNSFVEIPIKNSLKTKFIFPLLFFVCSSFHLFAQVNNWTWARSATQTSGYWAEGYSVSVDHAGNTFITGGFHSLNITFGSTTLVNADQTGNTVDFFIAKYSPNGNVLWAKRAGGTGGDMGYGINADAFGNVFVTGYFTGPVTFGSITLTPFASTDVFIVKYDTNGNVLWAKSAGGNVDEEGYSVSADKFGNVYVVGSFVSPTIAFGSTTLTNATSNGGNSDIFIAKYDVNGNVVWAQRAGTPPGDNAYSVSADVNGNIFVTGMFAGTITFGSFSLTTVGNGWGAFIVKCDSMGNYLWAKGAGGLDEGGNSVSADLNGNVFLTGYFVIPTITFGSTTLTNASASNDDAFIVKYDSTGNMLWAQRVGGTSNDKGYCVSTDRFGNAFVTGGFYSNSIVLGSNTFNVSSSGSLDHSFIAKYDPNGNVLCASVLTSGGDDNIGVGTDSLGNAYIGGDFTGPFVVHFVVGSDTLILSGVEDVFVAKYYCDFTNTITENKNEGIFSIYPNPSNGKFTLNSKITNGEISPLESVTICNVLGEIVFQSKINSQTTTIDLSDKASGIYFVNVWVSTPSGKTEKESFTQKIIIR